MLVESTMLIVVLIILIVVGGGGYAWYNRESFALKQRGINHTRRVTLHSVKWCPHCIIMKPIWEQVKIAVMGSGIIFTEVDEDIAKTPGINGYPTIMMLDENGQRSKYPGMPDFASLRAWVVNPVRNPEPV